MKWLAPLVLVTTVLLGQSASKDETFGIVRAFYLVLGRENKHIDPVAIYMYRSTKGTVFLKTYIYLNHTEFKGFIYFSYDKFEELKQSDIVNLGISLKFHPKRITINGSNFDFVDSLALGPEVEIT